AVAFELGSYLRVHPFRRWLQPGERHGPGQRLNRGDEVDAGEEHFEVDGAVAALFAAAAVEHLLLWIDGESISSAADGARARVFVSRAVPFEPRLVRLRDREHVDGAGGFDQGIPFVAAHAFPPRRAPKMKSSQ